MTVVIARFMRHLHQPFLVLDAIGLVAFSLGLLLRMAAIRWRLSLPVFSYSQTRWE